MATKSPSSVDTQRALAEDGQTPPVEANQRFSWRAAIIGLLFVPLCVYWIEYTEIVSQAADLVAMSLIISVVAFILLLIVVNQAVRWISPRLALTQSELLMIYVINACSVGICGIGMMQFLLTQIAAPTYFATADNHWGNWIHFLRPWAYPKPAVIADLYQGRSSLFAPGHLAGWMMPIAIWSVFIFVMVMTMYSLATLLRRQWVERERLLFPIVTIPLEITQDGGNAPIFRNSLFWWGFGIAVFVETLATLHYTVSPGIPFFPIKPRENFNDIGVHITSVPWNGIGLFQIAFYPMVIGLAYLLSLDVSFSTWFFYLVLKMESVSAVALGFKDPGAPPAISRIPYPNQQCAGAFTGVALMSLYFAWPHLKRAFQYAFQRKREQDASYSDAHEPMTYRVAYIGLFGGLIFMIAFAIALGIPLWLAVGFIVVFMLWAITMARIRAEAGLPWATGPGDNVHGTFVNVAGSQNFSVQELAGMISLRWMDADFRCLEMQQQIEAMKIADSGSGQRLLNARHMTWCITAAVILAIGASWFSLLSIYYQHGMASAAVDPWRTVVGQQSFQELQGWLTNRLPFDSNELKWILGGLFFSLFLSIMRTQFVWWPLHPIGYAISLIGIDLDWSWFPIFLGWLVKRLAIRYGGLRMYRVLLPFFIGLVIGDYVISSIFAALAAILHTPGYRTFPI